LPEVRCAVKSCDYWGKGEVCKADQIWVKHNTIGAAAPMGASRTADTEFAEELVGGTKEREARTSRQTQCETMKPRER